MDSRDSNRQYEEEKQEKICRHTGRDRHLIGLFRAGIRTWRTNQYARTLGPGEYGDGGKIEPVQRTGFHPRYRLAWVEGVECNPQQSISTLSAALPSPISGVVSRGCHRSSRARAILE
ncbi:hypothetical protein H0G86_000781 [Trichoderma simmonsii]|uniref:Uncharacterized protein n=1 Tax=Trichoderma simmonsii TaxID=1491479 RepID=A0A8G0L2I7_9HYPO|nr:hypothetical protein H0G86_000781 [Trichoderma simmonsii]